MGEGGERERESTRTIFFKLCWTKRGREGPLVFAFFEREKERVHYNS